MVTRKTTVKGSSFQILPSYRNNQCGPDALPTMKNISHDLVSQYLILPICLIYFDIKHVFHLVILMINLNCNFKSCSVKCNG